MNTHSILLDDFSEADLLPLHQEIYRFWLLQSEAQNGGLPQRDSFDPINFPKMLPWTLLLTVLRSGDEHQFKFRMLGTGLVEFLGQNLTGLSFEDATYSQQQDDFFVEGVKRVAATKKPIKFSGRSPMAKRQHVRLTGLLLPFTLGGGEVDIIMSIIFRERLRRWDHLLTRV